MNEATARNRIHMAHLSASIDSTAPQSVSLITGHRDSLALFFIVPDYRCQTSVFETFCFGRFDDVG